MYLIDTNIFLEILLRQEKSELCKSFLLKTKGSINISDFTLHSIGVILIKQNEEQIFLKFLTDTMPNANVLTLPQNIYSEIAVCKNQYGLDFDDAYQFCICKHFNLHLITMDRDFRKIEEIPITFI